MKKIVIFLKIFLLSKWIFTKPKPKKFLLVDGIYNPFLKYYDKKDFNIIHRRGESINIRVILKCLLNFDISTLNYFRQYIKLAAPKLILTAYDYNLIFYRLSKLSNAKTLMLQKAKRSKSDGIMSGNLLKKNKKKDFFVDYIFLYNQHISNFYKKFIKGKYINIGSFENNFEKINYLKQKKEILFISNFKTDNENKLLQNCENDDHIAYNLHKLAVSNKIKFNILPRQAQKEKNINEFHFYKNLLKKNFTFIKKDKLSSYKISNKYKFIFCTYSTLGLESLAKGGRVGFIFFKSKNNPTTHYRLGSLEKLDKRGAFWTVDQKFNINELKRVFSFVVKSKEKIWINRSRPVANRLLKFDYNNKLFRSVVSKELKKNKNK